MSKNIARMGKNTPLILKHAEGSFSDLITISSRKDNRDETIKIIKTNLAAWMKNEHFDRYRNQQLDVAIVLFVDEQKMKKQDVDNVGKIVLDALKQGAKDEHRKEAYLFDDDSQVVRLLVYKLPRCEDEENNTDCMVVSFRRHDYVEQMLLELDGR